MVRAPALLCSSLLVLLLAVAGASAQTNRQPRLGISVDGPRSESQWLLDLFEQELGPLMEPDVELDFSQARILASDGTRSGAAASNQALLDDDSVDVVVALGALVSADLAQRRVLVKPSIAPLAFNALTGDLPRDLGGGSGVTNLCYVEPVFDFAHDVRIFRRLAAFRQLAIVGDVGIIEAITNREFFELDDELRDLRVVAAPWRRAATASAVELPEGTDAVFLIGPHPGQEPSARSLLADLTARGIPTFASSGELGVGWGALAGLTPADWLPRVVRRCALHVRRILLGEPASGLATRLTRRETLFLNMGTARALGISPSFDLLSEAVLMGERQRTPVRSLDLVEAMREARARNRDVRAARRLREAAAKDVSIARAALLPQLDSALGYRVIDDDRASQVSAGAERTLAASLELTQVLWSEPALANVAVQRLLAQSQVANLRRVELDVTLEVADAFFGVLSASAVERIRRDNLRRTRSNLERAQVREQLGASSAAERYRWESQIAQDQDALVTSIAQRNLAEIEMNRVLSLPLEEKLGVQDPGTALRDVERYLNPRLVPFFGDADHLRRLRNYVSERALENSPEMRQLDLALDIQRRLLSSRNRSFYVPQLALTGDLTQTLDRAGEGAAAIEAAPLDDTDWEVQLGLSLPLFAGAERIAERGQLAIEIHRLEREREALAERIEQRVRSAIHVASASYTRIKLTREASEAGRRSYELVADAYARGALSIVDLIDAQTAWLNAEQQAASATYQFLADAMAVQRAAGVFLVLRSPEEQDQLISRLEEYFDAPDSISSSSRN